MLSGLASALLLYVGILLSMHTGTSSEGPEASGLMILLVLGYIMLAFFAEAPFILAIVYLTTAVGLFLSRRWAWHLSFMLSVLSIVLNVGQVAFIGIPGLFDLTTLFIALLILYYLTRPSVRHFFRSQRSELLG